MQNTFVQSQMSLSFLNLLVCNIPFYIIIIAENKFNECSNCDFQPDALNIISLTSSFSLGTMSEIHSILPLYLATEQQQNARPGLKSALELFQKGRCYYHRESLL